VFFDNFNLTHQGGPLFEETHYYPFGLTMGGVSSKAAGALENDKKYNGIELNEDLGLGTYDAFYRTLDPQIGRWWQIDPKVENMEAWSPFVSNFNSPFRFNDPLGDEPCCEEVWKDIKSAAKETATSVYNGAVSVARTVNAVNPIASVLEVITGKSSASDFTESKPRMQAFADLGVNVVMLLTGEIGATAKGGTQVATQGVKAETEIVQRAMTKAELKSTESTGLIRGGREGTHHVSNAIGNDAKKVRQRLALDNTPEVKVSMKVPKGSFSNPSRIEAANKMPGGGFERKATGNIPVEIVKVKKLINTAN